MNLDSDDVCAFAIQQLMVVGGGARRAQLEQWGVDRAALNRMLRRGMLQRQGRGYYVLPWSGDSSDRWQRQRSQHLRAVSAILGDDCVGGLRSAALAMGLPVARVPPIPEVLRPAHAAGLKGARVIRRAPDPQLIVVVNGVRVTNLERTAVDIALDLPTPEALITVDAALRRGADPQLMAAILAELGQVSGRDRARRTLDWADGYSESPLESRGRGELMLQGVPRPWSNVSLRRDGGESRTGHWWGGLVSAG
ncbi:MAG: type IV toxin-antitoxin system AbiEi family antitoxin domain-containing protein [Actinomycetia bacterium]|nr:type IV toxin-antitoxin system AbiEi family antitoxin domain-containing protein [Actinomycetes bacterium]